MSDAPSPPVDYVTVHGPTPTFRSAWVLGAVTVAAIIAWVLNLIGGIRFPSGAPLEWVMNAGLSLDLIAVAIACGVGCLISLKPRPAREAKVFPWLGLGLSIIAVVAWAIASPGLFETLLGGRGRYMNDTNGAFTLGIAWALGAIFSAYGYRLPARRWHNAAAITGIALWAVVAVGVVASALLYAADLTD